VAFAQAPFDLYDGPRRVAQGRARATRARAFLGTPLLAGVVVGVDARVERVEGETTIAQDPQTIASTYPALGVALFVDRLDRTDFPTHGGALRVQGLQGGGAQPFRFAVADWRQAWPLTSALVVTSRVAVGQSVRYALGQVQDYLHWSPTTLVAGGAVSVGGLTPLGPVEVVLGSGARRRSARLDVRVGYTF
jgi:hypothetical protein